ncbi:MAG: Unknown protein [uncultured Sulfurovum sp.]|uniref:Uncharacterized protein n=1 Tax=uncultured Sulfurovum sp. TaxID=269237 RepID=A0A6S6TST6_9BACT|nr:MAG: Unknown protein [uncultured Sulfurovum sp.]
MKKYILLGILPLLASTTLYAELGYSDKNLNNAKNNKKEIDTAIKAVDIKKSDYTLNVNGQDRNKVGSEIDTGKPRADDHSPTDPNGGTNPGSKEGQLSNKKDDEAKAKRDADVNRRLDNECARGSETACAEQERRRLAAEEKWQPNPADEGSQDTGRKGSEKQEREVEKLIENHGLGERNPIKSNGADGGEGDNRGNRNEDEGSTNNIPIADLAGGPCDGRTSTAGCNDAIDASRNRAKDRFEQLGGGNNPQNR